ncbi:MAG: ATP-binding protein [Cyanobacteria bacterium P01_D01_bin.105]
MSTNHRRFSYNQAPLPVKISLPFTLVFCVFWMAGVVLVGQYFSWQLDNDRREQTAELKNLVERELERDLEGLRRSARLLANDELVVQGAANVDKPLLQQEILPSKAILDMDAIIVTDRDLNFLMDTRTLPYQDLDIQTQTAAELMKGGAGISTVVVSEDDKPPVMIGTAPIKDESGLAGGVILGSVLSGDRLQQINASIDEQLVVLADHHVVASTFPSDIPDTVYADINDFDWEEQGDLQRLVTLQDQSYLAQAIVLEGLGDEHFEVILLTSLAPLNKAKRALWLLISIPGIASALLLAGVGYWLAKRIARPIQEITEVALNVVKDDNFDLQAPVKSQDEIGALATSLNQLITWVGEYTDALEESAQTLETRVNERTQELSQALEKLQETQSQLIQTEKMSSLGQMVAGIAHEINNPISFIQGNIKPLDGYLTDLVELLETYQEEYPNPTEAVLDKREEVEVEFLVEDTTKILNSMKMGTQRVRDIIVSLRNFSRLDESAIKDVDLCEGLDSTLLILNHRIKSGVKIIKSYDELPLVRCSPAQINQVFTNIIVNALDAMFEADVELKQLEITTRTVSPDHVQVCIQDSGPGMPPEVKSKIFDPFFTTKPVGKGTGLGLGICFKIIQQHQGTIEVHSEPGKGTEFVITLPMFLDSNILDTVVSDGKVSLEKTSDHQPEKTSAQAA